MRNLKRRPGFAFVAVGALAAGIAANAAVLSIVNGVLMSALPYGNPQQLVVMYEQVRRSGSRLASDARRSTGGAAHRITGADRLRPSSMDVRICSSRRIP